MEWDWFGVWGLNLGVRLRGKRVTSDFCLLCVKAELCGVPQLAVGYLHDYGARHLHLRQLQLFYLNLHTILP